MNQFACLSIEPHTEPFDQPVNLLSHFDAIEKLDLVGLTNDHAAVRPTFQQRYLQLVHRRRGNTYVVEFIL